jgi:uncharacterized protein (TIGR03067 family)
VLAACGVGHVADSAADLKAMQGTWTLTGSTFNGNSVMADLQWIVDGDHYRIRYNRQMDPFPLKITLDAATRHLDAAHDLAPGANPRSEFKGLYEVSGDTLRVCLDLRGQRYPESFDAPAGSKLVVYRFKRQ